MRFGTAALMIAAAAATGACAQRVVEVDPVTPDVVQHAGVTMSGYARPADVVGTAAGVARSHSWPIESVDSVAGSIVVGPIEVPPSGPNAGFVARITVQAVPRGGAVDVAIRARSEPFPGVTGTRRDPRLSRYVDEVAASVSAIFR